MLDHMGYNAVSTKVVKEIKAPMPGLVLDISVQEGDVLANGQRVVILEAMKMENSIVMHGEAKVKKVHVVKGQAVDKGQVLVELE
jgi:biotin carboxyl carrier protein